MGKDIIKTMYDAYWDSYEEHLRRIGENPKNIPQRKSTIKKFFRYLCEFDDKPNFEDIKKVHIQHFLSVQEKICSPKTVNRYYSFLKDFFMYFNKENVNRNTIFEHWTYYKSPGTDFITISEEEVMDLYNIICSYPKSEQALRLKIAFLILTYTGCTKEELCSLNVYRKSENTGDVLNFIVLEDKKVYFGKKKRKSNKTVSREIPLSGFIVDKINEYITFIESEKGINFDIYPYLFPSTYDQVNGSVCRLKSDQITAAIKSIVRDSKIVKNKKVSFQAFRNAFIKKLIEDKVPLQLIKTLSGLDIGSMKRFLNIEQYEKDQKEEIMKSKHPFRTVFNKIE
ncbi:site-specific integrase [Dehalobacter sp.]|uniref:tyrosine-type recombinase/integrase n=1 Tax=Dehalobacter sp. TaxID=1962289 RepID=UPI00258FFF8A|nr:site-specific integrase [Dehalobacter sp.]MDJ0306633.1 site-specific integrase [Dehalobacter sp.]